MRENVRHLFHETALEAPAAPAVERAGSTVTYGELEASASRLAAGLRRLGVARGDVVALLTSDPVAVIAGILGTVEAGGVFCPLEPTFPRRRLQAMARRAAPGWVVTESRHWNLLLDLEAEGTPVPRVILIDDAPVDGDGRQILRWNDLEADGVASADPDPDAPCSLYFTSGSTGEPKAILGRLRGIGHFVRWEAETLGVGRGTRVSQLAFPSFDGFLKDAFVPLTSGGVVCAPESRDVVRQPAALIDWVDIEAIEVLHTVPSVLRAMLREPLSDDYFSDLRWVVLAGEVLHPADVRRFRDVFADRIGLMNLYGPTETTVTKLFHRVAAADVERPSIPIGRPIPGAEALVVDPRGRACRPGMVGEIYLRTPHRALGYYGDPERTRVSFVANPLGDDPDDVVYRTGDYGRILQDGRLEFLGRRDQQVKVRGVRVELGEVEGLLRGRDGVEDVAVVDREDGEGNLFLCAYLVLAAGTDASDLRRALVEDLPEAMVPSAFVRMHELPRTLNGKLDRRALPTLEAARAEEESTERTAPRTAMEEIVAGIWSEVLRLPDVGVEESFFELGGHSLLATQIISRVRQGLGVELPLRAFFEAPTVALLAQRIEADRAAAAAEGGGEDGPALGPMPRDGVVPLSFSQQRMWLLSQLAAGSSAFNIPVATRLRGPLRVPVLKRTLAEVVRRHEILRTTFPEHGGVPEQAVAAAGPVPLPLVDLARLAPARREREAVRVGSAVAGRPFDLERGPLLRLVLVHLAAADHAVAGALHHMVGDAWSFDVLRAEIGRLYESFAAGRPSPLPELPIQFADYAIWQRRRLQGRLLAERQAYWRRKLAGAPRRLALPLRGERSAVQVFRGARLPLVLPEELAAGLRRLSRSRGTTLFMTALTGFFVLLAKTTGQEDLVVGSVVANRELAEVEPLIGFLANTVVLRADLTGDPSFEQLLGRVREVCLGAYSHPLPPEPLIEGLAGDRSPEDRLFDVWFQMESARREELELADLQWGAFDVERGETRFELSLVLEEDGASIRGEIEYDTGLFDAATVDNLRTHLLTVFERMVAAPERSITELSLASRQQDAALSRLFTVNLES